MTEPAILHSVPREMAADLQAELQGSVSTRWAETEVESRGFLEDAQVAVTGRFDEEWLAEAPDLEWIQTMSAGVDYLDLDAFEDAGVAVTNAAGVHAEPIGEQVLGYMLAFERQLLESFHNKQRGVWERSSGGELAGKTVGIIGLGAIGSRVAELASAFRMEVIGTKRNRNDAPDVVDEVFGPGEEDLREILLRSDYLVVACPLTEETEGLISRDELRTMPSDAVLINIARGEVVDEHALVRALQYRGIRGAGLDVFEEEPLPPDSILWDLSNVIITPHMGGSTPKYASRLAGIIERNLDAFEESTTPCDTVAQSSTRGSMAAERMSCRRLPMTPTMTTT